MTEKESPERKLNIQMGSKDGTVENSGWSARHKHH